MNARWAPFILIILLLISSCKPGIDLKTTADPNFDEVNLGNITLDSTNPVPSLTPLIESLSEADAITPSKTEQTRVLSPSIIDIHISQTARLISSDPRDVTSQLEEIGFGCDKHENERETSYICHLARDAEDGYLFEFSMALKDNQMVRISAFDLILNEKAEDVSKNYIRLVATLPLENINVNDVVDWVNANLSSPVMGYPGIYEKQFGDYAYKLEKNVNVNLLTIEWIGNK